jgi:hypothetical protein
VTPSRIALLSGIQRKLLVRALARLAWYRVALLVLPVPALLRRIERRAGEAPADFTPRDAAWAVHAAARRLPRTYCLARALALHDLLRRSGFPSELRIGVARAGAGIDAHAWVECAGEALGDEAAATYASLGTLPR